MTDTTIEGEEGIVQEFLAPLAAGYPGALGLKDDCATIAVPAGEELVVKTDPVVAGIHFPSGTDPADIGWRALAVNVSDLAAKGARPLAYLMALGLPAAPTRDWLSRFAGGLGEAQRAFGCHLIGGDTDRIEGPVSIAISVFGLVPAGRMVRRGAAEAGDTLLVSGTLGDASLGLQLLKDARARQRWGLAPEEAGELERRFLRPTPRLALGPLLRAGAHAAMDLSDGLVKDLRRMCAASGVGARVEAGRVPLSAPARKVIACEPGMILSALAAGDDYEILAAVPTARVGGLTAEAAKAGVPLTTIGEVVRGAGVEVIGLDGRPMALSRTGWDHFSAR